MIIYYLKRWPPEQLLLKLNNLLRFHVRKLRTQHNRAYRTCTDRQRYVRDEEGVDLLLRIRGTGWSKLCPERVFYLEGCL
jgi:hypothetical protein